MKKKTGSKAAKASVETIQFSSIEKKVEAIIKTVKREFPDLASREQGTIVTGIMTVDVKG